MRQFRVSTKGSEAVRDYGERFVDVRADDHQSAATRGIRLITRRAVKAMTAARVTGDVGKSGCFQGYRRARTGGESSWGPQVHVMEIES